MSVLTQAIPPQKFEIIRDRIGEILADEVNHQFLLTYNYNIDAEVWIERFTPFDKTDLPAINVCFVGGPYKDRNAKDTKGVYSYNIDVFTNAPSTNDADGSSLSTVRLHKLLGICRAILESPYYITLGYARPFSCTRYVAEIGIKQPAPGQDALNSMMGRLNFTVEVVETNELKQPVLIYEYQTQVKLGLTEKGYVFSGQNIPIPEIEATIITANDTVIIT